MVVHISLCWPAAAVCTHPISNHGLPRTNPYLSPSCTLPPSSNPIGVQPYSINNNKVLFLRPRPQPRPPKGPVNPGTNACAVDGRQLMDPGDTYCSIRWGGGDGGGKWKGVRGEGGVVCRVVVLRCGDCEEDWQIGMRQVLTGG
jgi:hypothetical protein